MTRDEAATVTKIALTADNWCATCQGGLLDLLRTAFPEHVETINDVAARKDQLEEATRNLQSDWYETYEGPEPTVLDVK